MASVQGASNEDSLPKITTMPAEEAHVEVKVLPTKKVSETERDFDATAVRVPLSRSAFVFVYIGLCLSLLLAALDQTIIGVALQQILIEFPNSQEYLPWVGSAYLITACSFSPLFGKLSDIFGRKAVFIATILVFELGSAICGAAPSMIVLIIGRAISGIGGGGIIALVLIIVSDIVSMQDRGKYQGGMGAVFGISSVVGPLIGGGFTDQGLWRWCFYINLPIGAVTLLAMIFFFHIPQEKAISSSDVFRVDFLGAFLIFAMVVAFCLPIQQGGTTWPWDSKQVIISFSLAAALLLILIFVERNVAKEPVIAKTVFQNRSVYAFFACSFFIGCTILSVFYYIALFFQVEYGYTATQAGLQTFPLIIGLTVFSVISGIVVSKYGIYKMFMFAGSIVTAVGVVLISTLDENSSFTQLCVYLFVVGSGVGLFIQMVVLGLQASVDQENIAVATALGQFFQTLGGAVGVAFTGALFNSKFGNNVYAAKQLSQLVRAFNINPSSAGSQGIQGLLDLVPKDPTLQTAIAALNLTVPVMETELKRAFADSFGFAFKLVLPFPIVVFLLSLLIKQYKMTSDKK